MRRRLAKLWNDDAGAVLATEWVFMATILVIGIIPGMVAVRNSMNVSMLKAACQLNSSSCACSSALVATPAANPQEVNSPPCD